MKWNEAWADQPGGFWALLVVAAIVLAGGAIKMVAAHWHDRKDEEIPKDLGGCLTVMHHCLLRLRGRAGNDGSLRLVLHRCDPRAQRAKQLTHYVGGPGGKVGRMFSAKSGVIGQAIRTKRPQIAQRTQKDWEDWVETLKTQFGYAEDEALGLRRDRFAFMAVPLVTSADEVRGVLYLDSTEKDFFTAEITEEILGATSALVDYIRARYT